MLDPAGTWLPEPILDERPGDNPEQESGLWESIGLALLIVLENLTPLERLTFVLHDVFAVPSMTWARYWGDPRPPRASLPAGRGPRRSSARPAVVSFTVAAGRITAIDIIGQPKFRLSAPPR